MHKISFPGLGIGEFEINPTAFHLGNRPIAWYGIIITSAIILTVFYIYLRGKRKHLLMDDLIDIAFCTVIPGIIGARLYYVFFDWLKDPSDYKTFIDIIAVWNGGLAIYGGIIFGALGCLCALRWKKIRIPAFFDILAPAVQIAQAIGRWGNFANAEAFGSATTLPWRMRLECIDHTCRDIGLSGVEVHPTFLYESLWNVLGFILLSLYSKKKKFDGEILLLYLGWYGLGRAFIEGLRTDSLYLGRIRISQMVAILCVVASVALLCYFYFVKRLRTVADCIYLPAAKNHPDRRTASENKDKDANSNAECNEPKTEEISETQADTDPSENNSDDTQADASEDNSDHPQSDPAKENE